MEVYELIESLQLRGIEEFKRYYGIYRAIVSSVKDPEKRGRVQVLVPVMGHSNPISLWIDPSMTGAGTNRGSFWMPEEGDRVRVNFERGDSGQPVIYFSGWYGTSDLPSEFAYSSNGRPEKKGFITRLGHRLIFSDTPGEEYAHLSCHFPIASDKALLADATVSADRTKGISAFIDFSTNGVTISNQNGSIVSLDAKNNAITVVDQTGNSISMNDNGISLVDNKGQSIFMSGDSININSDKAVTVSGSSVNINAGSVFLSKGATFSTVLGELFLLWANSHVHTSTVPGTPTSPTITPALGNLLSKKVKTG